MIIEVVGLKDVLCTVKAVLEEHLEREQIKTIYNEIKKNLNSWSFEAYIEVYDWEE